MHKDLEQTNANAKVNSNTTEIPKNNSNKNMRINNNNNKNKQEMVQSKLGTATKRCQLSSLSCRKRSGYYFCPDFYCYFLLILFCCCCRRWCCVFWICCWLFGWLSCMMCTQLLYRLYISSMVAARERVQREHEGMYEPVAPIEL